MISHGDNAIHIHSKMDLTPKELSIFNCGYFYAINSPYRINVDSFMLLYQHKGNATISIDNVKHKIGPGTTVLLKNMNLNIINYHKDPVNERYYIYFGGDRVISILTQLGLQDISIFSTGPRNEFREYVKEIIEDYNINNKFTLLSLSILLKLLSKTKQLSSKNSSKVVNSRIQPALEYMKTNFANPPLKLEEYAKMCFISPITLIKYFKKETKMAPLEYFTSIKIANAQSQLANSYKSISEIAESLSYFDPLYFSRVFKKFTGLPPSKYRKMVVQK